MALDVKVSIDRKKVLGGSGFGIPLVFVGNQPDVIDYTECSSVDEVAEVFGNDTDAYIAAGRIFGQQNPPAKIAVYGGTAKALDEDGLPAIWDKEWRQLVIATPGRNEEIAEGGGEEGEEGEGQSTRAENTICEIAAYFEAKNDKVYFASVKALDEVIGAQNAITAYSRLMCLFHPDDVVCPEAAVVGATAGLTVGSFTYKNLIIKGLVPSALTAAAVKDAAALGCLAIVEKAGDIVTTDGRAADGEFLDIVDSRDYIIREIEYRTQKTLNANSKIPYDNNGIALLESICVDVLQNAFANGIIAVDENNVADFSVSYAARDETQASDREARRYVEGNFTFALAGAVHEAIVHGVIEI